MFQRQFNLIMFKNGLMLSSPLPFHTVVLYPCSLFRGGAPNPTWHLRQRPGSHPWYILLHPLQSLPESTHWQFLTILPFNIFAFLFVAMSIIALSCIQFLPATGPLHTLVPQPESIFFFLYFLRLVDTSLINPGKPFLTRSIPPWTALKALFLSIGITFITLALFDYFLSPPLDCYVPWDTIYFFTILKPSLRALTIVSKYTLNKCRMKYEYAFRLWL